MYIIIEIGWFFFIIAKKEPFLSKFRVFKDKIVNYLSKCVKNLGFRGQMCQYCRFLPYFNKIWVFWSKIRFIRSLNWFSKSKCVKILVLRQKLVKILDSKVKCVNIVGFGHILTTFDSCKVKISVFWSKIRFIRSINWFSKSKCVKNRVFNVKILILEVKCVNILGFGQNLTTFWHL